LAGVPIRWVCSRTWARITSNWTCTFVNNLAKDARKQAQLKELVQNLDALGATTIVGGVEDVQAMPILWSLGIDLIQGFFLQHPYSEMSYDFSTGAF
jgi:EAL domain-containing protein (putative c-di-GMP-specific phosphodiesterase class I)